MKKGLLLFGVLLTALIAHTLSQYQLFSLFHAATSIPLILMLITPLPAALIFCTFIILELFSSLPHGSMVLMFLIPYVVTYVWKKLRVELSWKFLFGILLIITLQTTTLMGIVALMSATNGLDIPWRILMMQIGITSVGTFVLSFIYHEYSNRL